MRVPERVTFGLCVLAYRCLYGTVPSYIAGSLLWTSDVDTQRRLRSADTVMLAVPSSRRSVASARTWNSLPSSVRYAPSLTTFRRELKTVLFRSSFDDQAIVIVLHNITVLCPRLLTAGGSILFVFFVLFNVVRCPCNVIRENCTEAIAGVFGQQQPHAGDTVSLSPVGYHSTETAVTKVYKLTTYSWLLIRVMSLLCVYLI